MNSYNICLLLLPSLFSYFVVQAEENTWNQNNVGENLKEWLKSMENTQIVSDYTDRLSNTIPAPCYTSTEVLSQYKQLQNGQFEHLEGNFNILDQVAGRLILAGEKSLEATNFHQGLAQGIGKITFHSHHHHSSNDSFLTGKFQNGCLHGLIKGYEFLPLDGVEDDPSFDSPVLDLVAFYKGGYPNGPIWKTLFSPDGIVLGYFYVEKPQLPNTPNSVFEFSSQKNVIFLYPDLLTGIQGQFTNQGLLIGGRHGKVLGERNSEMIAEEGLTLKEIQFVVFDEPETEAALVKSDLSTKEHLSSTPLSRDIYEAKMVDVLPSTITKAGDGVFLLTDVSANTVVAYFNGIRLTRSDVFSWNPFKKASVYLVETTDLEGNEIFLDIPQKYASWKKYKASAGHKVNHSKTPNAGYTECEHPVFGKILCLYTTQDLKKGTELFTQYEVSMDKEGMKHVLKAALEIGHRYTGKSRKEFAKEVRPYLEMASNFAEKLNLNDYLLSFN